MHTEPKIQTLENHIAELRDSIKREQARLRSATRKLQEAKIAQHTTRETLESSARELGITLSTPDDQAEHTIYKATSGKKEFAIVIGEHKTLTRIHFLFYHSLTTNQINYWKNRYEFTITTATDDRVNNLILSKIKAPGHNKPVCTAMNRVVHSQRALKNDLKYLSHMLQEDDS